MGAPRHAALCALLFAGGGVSPRREREKTEKRFSSTPPPGPSRQTSYEQKREGERLAAARKSSESIGPRVGPVVETGPKGGKRKAVKFDSQVAAHFLADATNVDEVLAQGKREGKPVMVIATEPWCAICRRFMEDVNKQGKVRGSLGSFLVVHAQGEAAAPWRERAGKTQIYVPQAFWFGASGQDLGIEGAEHKRFSRFFSTDDSLADAMQRALVAYAGASTHKEEL